MNLFRNFGYHSKLISIHEHFILLALLPLKCLYYFVWNLTSDRLLYNPLARMGEETT